MEETVPTSAGLSSFNLLDEEKLFRALALQPGMTMLDLACGVGNYAVAASPHIGRTGRIYAVDLWEEGIETLDVRSSIGNISNIEARVAEAGELSPVADQSIDLCLMATVAHILIHEDTFGRAMSEIKRVLKPEGVIAVVEFEKIDGPPGPPISMRLSPSELADILASYGFEFVHSMGVGQYNYLSLFR